MRKNWVALTVCVGFAAAFTWGMTQATQAAMPMTGIQADSSLIELARKKKKGKVTCQQKLIFKCCTRAGKPEMCTIM
jgi:hypothetical protein